MSRLQARTPEETAAMVVKGFCIQRGNRLASICDDGHVVGIDSDIDYKLSGDSGNTNKTG